MSFDIWLIKFSKGNAIELPRDPIRAALEKHPYTQTGEDYYDINFPDGSHVEFSADGLTGKDKFDSAAFYLRSLSDAKIQFIHEVAKAADCILILTMEKNPCVLTHAAQRAELPADFDLPLVDCPSPAELTQLITGGFQAWSNYRDHILSTPPPPNPDST